MNELEKTLVSILTAEGAAMVGFADISDLPARERRYMDSAVSIS